MKSHTKSRRGCVQCKHRKVKCDETLPCCDRCRRRHEHCSYLDDCYPDASASPSLANNNSTTSINNFSNNTATTTTTTNTATSGLVTTPASSHGSSSGAGPYPSASSPAAAIAAATATTPGGHHPNQYFQQNHGFRPAYPGLDTAGLANSGSLSMSQSPAPTPLLGPAVADPSNTYLFDMELLHFYLTQTYKTLWGRVEGKLVWRDVIYREALQHPAVLNGLLALAAYHRIVTLNASHGPDAAAVYYSVALYKQRQALEGLVVMLRSLNADSCRAIFPLSMMVSFWAFVSRHVPEELGILTTLDVNGAVQPVPGHASPDAAGHHPHAHVAHARSALDLFVELIRRIRAVQLIAHESIHWLTRSDFVPLMVTPDYKTLPPLPDGIARAVELLDQHVQRTPRIAAMLSGLEARYSLYTMYQISRSPDWLELITGWPMVLPQSFVESLARRDHAALTVFAYWLGCFQVLEDRWWAQGWTAALMSEIEQTVRGGEWAGLVEWVRMYISIVK